jgi:mycothiol synthase
MTLPDDHILRHPSPSDAAAVQAVLDAAESADTGEPRRHLTVVATQWMDPACSIARDWWVIDAPDGTIVATGWVLPQPEGEVVADHYVHPDHRGLGLGEVLLDTIERRAAELPGRLPDGSPRHLVVWAEDIDRVRLRSLERREFVAVRQYFEMAIGLGDAIEPAAWPDGVSRASFREGIDDQAVHELEMEAFVEHHLFRPESLEDWRVRRLEASNADTALWSLAWDGDELVGYVVATNTDEGGLINDLAVRKPRRGRGIAQALLSAAFATLRDRGQTIARLYVDAQNVTNAARVYEGAGMQVVRRFHVMQKPLA